MEFGWLPGECARWLEMRRLRETSPLRARAFGVAVIAVTIVAVAVIVLSHGF